MTITNSGLSAIIVAREKNDTLDIKFYSKDYLYQVCHTDNLDTSGVENLLTLFFSLENYCFGTTDFYHIPPALFKISKITDSSGNKIISIKDNSNTQTTSLIHCVTFYHCVNNSPCNNRFCDRCPLCETTICHNEETPPPGGGGTGGDPTGGGGSGGGGSCPGCPPPPPPPNCDDPFYFVDPCDEGDLPPDEDPPPTQEQLDLIWII